MFAFVLWRGILYADAAMGYIELARWADRILIALATADFIARWVVRRLICWLRFVWGYQRR
jgi:hypothetical protein